MCQTTNTSYLNRYWRQLIYKSLMDWVRQAPGLRHACTKELSHSHSFIKIKFNLQWSWQLSSHVTNQPVIVGQTKWILPHSLSKAGWKTRFDEWWSLAYVVQGCTSVAWGTQPTAPSKRGELRKESTPGCLQLCSCTRCVHAWGQQENTIAVCWISVSLTPQNRGVAKSTSGMTHRSRPELIFYTLFSFYLLKEKWAHLFSHVMWAWGFHYKNIPDVGFWMFKMRGF